MNRIIGIVSLISVFFLITAMYVLVKSPRYTLGSEPIYSLVNRDKLEKQYVVLGKNDFVIESFVVSLKTIERVDLVFPDVNVEELKEVSLNAELIDSDSGQVVMSWSYDSIPNNQRVTNYIKPIINKGRMSLKLTNTSEDPIKISIFKGKSTTELNCSSGCNQIESSSLGLTITGYGKDYFYIWYPLFGISSICLFLSIIDYRWTK